jgi:hypothetical protein
VIPEQLREEPLIRLKPGSKEPVRSVYAVESVERVTEWIEGGGNVGVSLQDDLVVLDADSREMAGAAVVELPRTFVVRTGSGGTHLYYRCAEWTENKQFTADGDDLGSVRTDGWQVACPPSIHPSGEPYRVASDRAISTVGAGEIETVVESIGGETGSVDDRGSESRERSRSDLDELDELIDHDGHRAEIREILNDPTAPHDRRVYLAGFLHDAVGLSAGEITSLIARHNRWDNFDRATTRRQVESVIESAGGGR